MGIKDILNSGKIKNENDELKKVLDEIGGKEIVDMNSAILEFERKKNMVEKELLRAIERKNTIDKEIIERQNQIVVLDDEIMFESFSLYKPRFDFLTSDEYKERLSAIRDKQKVMIKNKTAVTGNQGWTVNGSKAQGNKMVNDMIKLLLRSFNNECDYCVSNVKFNNIESHEKQIEKSFETINKLGVMMQIQIMPQYKKLKYDELYLAYEYQQKKQEEKEEQKRNREELREQAKLEKEIRDAREKIEKERKHFNKAISEIEEKLKKDSTDEERLNLQNKLEELLHNVSELEKEESLIDYREKNAKAGYVYIISNIGAFGEGIYKIGMTRRLEPMDRVDELGDASVPFSFDVHALIFSENAPELESKLHQYFSKNRINKINNRKEFFRADIKEIERVIKENYDKVLDIVETPFAEQYRESLKIEN